MKVLSPQLEQDCIFIYAQYELRLILIPLINAPFCLFLLICCSSIWIFLQFA